MYMKQGHKKTPQHARAVLQQALVDLGAQLAQTRPVGQIFAHSKVERIIDGRFCPQRTVLFELDFLY